ncbi:sugar-transfer associated ATP-grasp domain-containing protein [Oricola sp.]|uniref:sugar-transfer associated ATP-grasp domain-containing protein n=1 Tax=Oricola sp. TaxID=1979950 RepID=UPI0025EBAA29|nr:sugar-transfer associated ATP-grasp domain-containing protein [Oricola sp.]MCI5078605.1 hypothetical protein [Oricola sp.]
MSAKPPLKKRLRKTGDVLSERISERLYHRKHRKEALRYLRSIEQDTGPLSQEIVRRCDDYARDVFGSKLYAPWLYVYSAVAGEFREGWMPDNYYGRHVVRRGKGAYGAIANQKAVAPYLFGDVDLPDLAYCVNGRFYDRNNHVLDAAGLQACLFSDRDRVVFKEDDSARGKGIHFFGPEDLRAPDADRLGNGVFQKLIRQHAFFEDFTASSVATLRLTSVVDPRGVASVRAAYLRFGRTGDTHVKFGTSVSIPVDVATGELGAFGYLPNWRRTDRHPDSGVEFANRMIPGYSQCVEIATRLQARFPYAYCIGWDFTIDQAGEPQILEWNGGHNGVKFTEATQGPGFGDLQWENIPRLW